MGARIIQSFHFRFVALIDPVFPNAVPLGPLVTMASNRGDYTSRA
jgi:hypothetical protein